VEQSTTPTRRVLTPAATSSLVLGILSLVLSGCFVVGLVLGLIGLAHARKGTRDLEAYPNHDGAGMVMAGRICSIIGVVLCSLQLLFWLGYLLVILVLMVLAGAGPGPF